MNTPRLTPRARMVALALTAATALTVGCKRPAAQGEVTISAESTGPIRVAVAAAQAHPLDDTLSATGSLVAEEQSQVTPIVAGRVTNVLVERGSRVHEGDPMIRLRDADYRSNAAAASAQLAGARSRLGLDGEHGSFSAENTAEVRGAAANRDLAEDALRRAEPVHASGGLSDQEYQRVLTQAVAAREQYRSAVNQIRASYYAYQQAREQVTSAQRAVSDSVIRAPFDGEVAERTANVGEYVSPQRAVVTLVKTDNLRMEIQVPQERVGLVHEGQTVAVSVDAFPGHVFQGTVRYISASVRTDTRSLVAEALVPNPDHQLRPGMFATARLNLGTRRDAVQVPARAVLSEAGVNRVFVVSNGRAAERVVTVAERHDDQAVIDHGVAAGEEVAVDNVARLSDGAQVTR